MISNVFSLCGSIILWAYFSIVVAWIGIKNMFKYKDPTKRQLKIRERMEKKYG